MTVEEFLAWAPPDSQHWQLVDGEPQAMAPASRTHNSIQGELQRLLANHLAERGSPCIAIPNGGIVPRVQSETNFRIPDLVVTCSGYDLEEYGTTDPVLLIEILSPSNQAETWANVWAHTTIPSVQEIVVIRSATIGAELLRRKDDGSWPDRPASVIGGELVLDSVGFRLPLEDLYRTT
ncbi:MAG: Uma2 family endonuclease, partial [Acetobacteraceae bacterium]|nr:Uma2 family endonuclease [Acetobacteraceae bacterium]